MEDVADPDQTGGEMGFGGKGIAGIIGGDGAQAGPCDGAIFVTHVTGVSDHEIRRHRRGTERTVQLVDVVIGWAEALDRAPVLQTAAGVSIENKGVTATIHYRLSPDPELARQKIMAAIEKSGPAGRLRIKPGKMSLNLLPPLGLDKGTAVAGLIKEYNLQSGLYLGDDSTDIDAFRAIHNASEGPDFKGYAIAVTSREMPAGLVGEADFTLEGIAEVERFLGWLARKTS